MLLGLQKYDLGICYQLGKFLYIADTLSRAYEERVTSQREQCADEVFGIQSEFEREIQDIDMVDYLPMTKDKKSEIQSETDMDRDLGVLKTVIFKGWPDDKDEVPMEGNPYFHIRDELSVHNGIVYRGSRAVIPKSLRQGVMVKLHEKSHIGVEGCLRTARELMCWPLMNSEVQNYINKCETCNTFNNRQAKEPLRPHDTQSRPWAKVGADMFMISDQNYLVTVDYYSNYFDVDRLDANTTSQSMIHCLKSQFRETCNPEYSHVRQRSAVWFSERVFPEVGIYTCYV